MCGALPEHDELDKLDGPAYITIAKGIPYSSRIKVLGENYLNKLSVLGMKTEKVAGPGVRPPTAKSKGKLDSKKVDAKSVKMGDNNVGNVLLFDPDGIPAVSAGETSLIVGAFSVSPRIGVISPGQVVGIDITFDPVGCDAVREKLRFVLTGTDENDALYQAAAAFDLTGDSCFPSIITEDISSIFEEVEVVPSLSASLSTTDRDRDRDREGDREGDEGEGGDGKYNKLPVGKVVYAVKENIMAWGPVMCGTSGTRGVVERIKITNPTKIDTKVRFKILTVEEASELASGLSTTKSGIKESKVPKKDVKIPKGGAAVLVLDSAFSVQPEVWDIPPHEHRYVSVYFKPCEIRSYRAVFYADVEDGSSTSLLSAKRKPVAGSGTSLSFSLGGSGTMPCITIEEPTQRLPDGSLLIDFNRVHIDRTSCRKITIKNHGSMSATCLFDVSGCGDFIFSSINASLTLEPGQKEDLTVSYSPKNVIGVNQILNATVRVSVLNNQFDQYQLKLKGIAYECDAVIDLDTSNQSTVESIPIGQEMFTFPQINLADASGNVCNSTYTFTLRSRCAHPLKFDFSVPEGEIE